MTLWLILTATLPTSPSGLRVRIWRALKATRCASLREGVYLLPTNAASATAFRELDVAIREAGAESHLLELNATDPAQEARFRALFDRSLDYSEFSEALRDARKSIQSATQQEMRKLLRSLETQLQTILSGDFFQGSLAQSASSELRELRDDIAQKISPGEPATIAGQVPVLAKVDFQGRTWVTRVRPWVDRLATAWLVQRFVDATPEFVWLADTARCPSEAVGYDFDGARFSHVGTRVTFEVVAASFSLDRDPGLQRLAELVHCIDAGGVAIDEAPGLELIIRGLQAQHADDDRLLAAAVPVFDAVYAALRSSP